jgi:hypothetical protein
MHPLTPERRRGLDFAKDELLTMAVIRSGYTQVDTQAREQYDAPFFVFFRLPE